MYVEQTANNRIAINDLTFEETQLIVQALIELKGKLKDNKHFIHELKLTEKLYKEIDRELLIAHGGL